MSMPIADQQAIFIRKLEQNLILPKSLLHYDQSETEDLLKMSSNELKDFHIEILHKGFDQSETDTLII
jgi:hypothetical protein